MINHKPINDQWTLSLYFNGLQAAVKTAVGVLPTLLTDRISIDFNGS
jgi:hypothetical protein